MNCMKKMSFLCLLLLLFFVSACSEKDDGEPVQLELTQFSLVFHTVGGSKSVVVKTNVADCSVRVPVEDASWCSASVVSSDNNRLIQVDVRANEQGQTRTTTLTIAAGDKQVPLAIEQLGTDPQILLAVSNFTVGFLNSALEIEVVSNVEFTAKPTESWITEKSDESKAMNSEVRVFKIEMNDKTATRFASVDFNQVGGSAKNAAFISQTGMNPGEGSDAIQPDSLVRVSRAEATSEQLTIEPGPVSLAIDGDLNTFYHSNWNNGNPDYFPIDMTFYFDDPAGADFDYVVYNPRPSGNNGLAKEIELQVATVGAPDHFVKYGDYDFKGSSSPSRILFKDGGLKQVKGVRFRVKSGVGDGQGFVSCAEMQFFKKREGALLTSIFIDDICSALRPEVTAADIDTMSNPFFKNIAGLMFVKAYDTEFRIQEYKAWQNPDIQAGQNKTNPYSLMDNPTGISVTANEEVVVLVGDLHGQSVTLLVQDQNVGFGGPSYLLNEGVNKVKVGRKGLLYIQYHTPTGQEPPVRIHIASGRVNGYFDIAKHSASDWRTLLNKSVDAHFDVVGKYAHMTFPTAKFKQNTKDGLALIGTADEIVRLEQELLGLFKYGKTFNNRLYMHVVYDKDSYMYATSYRTAYNIGTLDELTNNDRLRSSAIWGPAHEIGHCNQTRPGFKWIGMTEVSNNLMSQFVQRKIAHDSRLQTESPIDAYINRYNKAFNTTIAAGIPAGAEGDVFCKLVPFWQLYLYMTEVLGKTDFYPDLYEMVRIQPNPATNGLCQLNFVRLACRSSKLNLVDFFTVWGFLSPIDVMIEDYSTEPLVVTQQMIDDLKAEIAAENYPLPSHKFRYITDNTLDLYRANQPVVCGTAIKSGNAVQATNWKNVAAFESYDANGVLKGITTENTIRTFGGKVYAVAANGDKSEVMF